MGLSKDLEKMSRAIKKKLGGGSAEGGGGNDNFNMLHFFIVMSIGAFMVYLVYHLFMRKKFSLLSAKGISY